MTGTSSRCSASPPGPRAASAARAGAPSTRTALGFPVGHRRPRDETGRRLGQVLVPSLQIAVPDRRTGRRDP